MTKQLQESRTVHYLLACGAAFVATVAVCAVLDPDNILSHDGLSFYGNFERTLLPYGLGLVATAYFLLRAWSTIPDSPASHSFRVGLEIIAVGLLGIVATPSLLGIWVVQELHVLFGLAIFVMQAILSLHYLSKMGRSDLDWVLLGLQMLAIVLVALSFNASGMLSIMLPAQVLACGSFGLLLIRAVRRNGEATAKT